MFRSCLLRETVLLGDLFEASTDTTLSLWLTQDGKHSKEKVTKAEECEVVRTFVQATKKGDIYRLTVGRAYGAAVYWCVQNVQKTTLECHT